MRSLAAALLALVPAGASAQVGQITLKLETNRDEVTVNRSECARVIRVDWTITAPAGTECKPMLVWLTAASSCGDRPSTGDVELENLGTPTTNAGSFTFLASQLPLFQGASAVACPAEDKETPFRLCATYATGQVGFGCTQEQWIRAGTPPTLVRYDTRPPAVPAIESAQGLDGSASVTVSATEDAATIIVEASAEGQTTRSVTKDARSGAIVINDMTNSVEYSVTARARDLAGNESEASGARTVTPVATAGLWQRYKEAGGTEAGGCSQAGGGALALFGALAALRFTRRRRS